MFTFRLRLSEKSTADVNGVGQFPDWLHWWCMELMVNSFLADTHNFEYRNDKMQLPSCNTMIYRLTSPCHVC